MGDDRRPYLERFLHGEIYRQRPDVMAIVHSHSDAVIPFGITQSAMKPVWDGKQFAPRMMLPLSFSYDHRVIDGALKEGRTWLDPVEVTRFVQRGCAQEGTRQRVEAGEGEHGGPPVPPDQGGQHHLAVLAPLRGPVPLSRMAIGQHGDHRDEQARGGKHLPLKAIIDEAIGMAVTDGLIGELARRSPDEDQSLYLQVTRGVAKRDHAFPKEARPTVFMMTNPLVTPDTKQIGEGVGAVSATDNPGE